MSYLATRNGLAMKIFVIGGVAVPPGHEPYEEQSRLLVSSMERVGTDLMTMGHDLVACSPFEGSADLAAVCGAKSALLHAGRTGPSIEIHCPGHPDVLSAVAALTGPPPHSDFRLMAHPVATGENRQTNWEHTWLLSQLAALQSSHAVLPIGGKSAGTANLLLALAMTLSA